METVDDLMTADLVFCRSGESSAAARSMMLEREIHGLPVLDDLGNVIGIVTSHDLVDDDPDMETVNDVMSTNVATIDAGARITEAAAVMRDERLHHLVVVDGAGHAVGVLSTFDLLSVLAAGNDA